MTVRRERGGGSGGGGFYPGQHLRCTIQNERPKGYNVLLHEGNLRGFLPTQQQFNFGDEILTQYVTYVDGRYVVAPLVSGTHKLKTDPAPTPKRENKRTTTGGTILRLLRNEDSGEAE